MYLYKNKKRVLSIILALLLTIIPISSLANTQSIDYVKELISTYYYGDIPSNVYQATNPTDMVNRLGDPYSQYFTAEELNAFIGGINMDFSGIGVFIDTVPEGILIISVIDNSGALEAGLKAGDIIVKANGISVVNMSQEEAVSLIRGPEGTSVILAIKRDGTTFEVSVMRKRIHVPTVQGEMLENGIAYIKINSFGEITNAEFNTVLMTLQSKDPMGYILDVRGNPGGYLHTAADLVGYFAPGETAITTRNKEDEVTIYPAGEPSILINKPAILLANRFSASASEIYAAAFKDYKKGIIVGEDTFGKGTVQNLFLLPTGDVLKLTVEQFFSPLGWPINGYGVTPHIQSGKVDPLAMAELLFGKAPTRKNEYIQLLIEGKVYEIDLKKARQADYWEAYAQLVSKVKDYSKDIKLGTYFGWRIRASQMWQTPWRFYYPDYIELPRLQDVSINKEFTVKFSGPVGDAIHQDYIELIHQGTGERVELNLSPIDERSYKVVPSELLTPGESYYLVIHMEQITGRQQKGYLTQVTVEK